MNASVFSNTVNKSTVNFVENEKRSGDSGTNSNRNREESQSVQYGGHQIGKGVNESNSKKDMYNSDTHEGKDNTLRNSNTTKVIYSVDILIKELKKIHDNLYKKRENDTCKIRPASCVIIGIAKSGTQELLNFLSIHPNVVQKHNLPNPNLFDKNSYLDRRKEKMPCTYSDQIGIVKTDYFFFREEMPDKFYKFNKKLKMILLVREPVERLISAYSFTYLQKKQHKLVFNYRLEDVPEIDSVFVDQQNGRVKTNQFDLTHSVYDLAMERYLKYFSRDQILVIESSEFRKDPAAVLQRVEQFLGLKHVIKDDYFAYNKNKHFHCLKTLQGMVCYGSDRGRAKLKDITPETRRTLHAYFKPHNERFFELIGKRFNWTGL
ncbi:heparan sulfate glucosamine 3-O-sulfotransferase 1-like [Mercenaria mercenaria]|uniref:heparan sulfate glucosamine 3-O-sulfotransferase 1-like n=1 Tax=Mercenaria mercenaria TaxID=6596 RepID=UPI001E1DDE96|nr:heparan sulfate glucosamine 3-O-sulfotransferase 1-like [Mercenaria mercenaria]